MGLEHRAALVRWRDFTQAISKKTEVSACGNRRIQLPNAAGSRIARIHKGLFAFGALGNFFTLALVKGFEVGAAHVHLAAHFEYGGGIGRQSQRYLPDGAHVLRDFLAHLAVPAGCRLHKHAGLVTQVHREAVKLQFGHIGNRWIVGLQPEFPAYPGIKILRAGRLGIGLGADAQHRHLVAHAGKLPEWLAAHALGGRVGA